METQTNAQPVPQPVRHPIGYGLFVRLVRWLARSAAAFFDAAPAGGAAAMGAVNQNRAVGNRPRNDPLLDVVRRDPQAAARFIRTVMAFSGIGGAVVSVVSLSFLLVFWQPSGHCDRPLRWWLLGHALQQLTQVPVRFVFLLRIRLTEGGGGNLETCVASFTASMAWKTSRSVATMTYGWLVLGVVWTINAGDCAAFPGIYRMTVSVILQAVCRAGAALLSFRAFFPRHTEMDRGFARKAATPSEIALHTRVIPYSEALFEKEPDAVCAICLAEFTEGAKQNKRRSKRSDNASGPKDGEEALQGDLLRALPCGHMFHNMCAQRWLGEHSKRCPLCVRAIDEAIPATWPVAFDK